MTETDRLTRSERETLKWNDGCSRLSQLISQLEDTAKQEQKRMPRPLGIRTPLDPYTPSENIIEEVSPAAAQPVLWF